MGAPVHEDRRLLEFLVLEGAQAGLIWPTIPRKRENYRLALSRDLKRRGFQFAGPTICCSFMQAVGMVRGHVVDCFRWEEIRRISRA